LDETTRTRLRLIIKEAKWKKASSPRYKTAPHSYIIAHNCGPEWKWFYEQIRNHGTYRTWHGHRYKYLILDRYCYWVDWPALNRAKADTLDPLPKKA